jgi:hypothetical protein
MMRLELKLVEKYLNLEVMVVTGGKPTYTVNTISPALSMTTPNGIGELHANNELDNSYHCIVFLFKPPDLCTS